MLGLTLKLDYCCSLLFDPNEETEDLYEFEKIYFSGWATINHEIKEIDVELEDCFPVLTKIQII